MYRTASVEEKLEIIRHALENGADVQLNFHNVEGWGRAKAIIKQLAEMSGAEIMAYSTYFTFGTITGIKGLCATAHFELSKEEHREILLKQLKQLEGEEDASRS